MKFLVRINQQEDGRFQAECMTLPGCITCAPTRDEADGKLDDAIRGYLAAVANFVPETVNKVYIEERERQLIA